MKLLTFSYSVLHISHAATPPRLFAVMAGTYISMCAIRNSFEQFKILIQYYICVHIWVDTYLMRHKQSQYVTNNVYLNVAMYLHVLLYVIVACGVDTLL